MAAEDDFDLDALLDEYAAKPADDDFEVDVSAWNREEVEVPAAAPIVRQRRIIGSDYTAPVRRALNIEDVPAEAAAPTGPTAPRRRPIDHADLAWGVAAVLSKPTLDVKALQNELNRYMRGKNLFTGDQVFAEHDFSVAMDSAVAPPTTCVLYAPEDKQEELAVEAAAGTDAADQGAGAVMGGMRLHQLSAWHLLRGMAVAQRSDFKALAKEWRDVSIAAEAYAGWEDMPALRTTGVTFDGTRTPKGVLMFHSTGTGKTAVSVGAMQAFWQQYDRPLLYVSTSAAVQSVIGKRATAGPAADESGECGGEAFKSEYARLAELLYPTTLGSNKHAYDAKLNSNMRFGQGSRSHIAGQCVQSYLGNPSHVSSRLKAITFRQAAEFAEKTRASNGGEAVDEMCDTKTTIDGVADKPRFGSSPENRRSIGNAVMIIDEAHNLLAHLDWDADQIAQAVRSLPSLPADDKKLAEDILGAIQLRKFLQSPDADGVTLVLLTATPGATPREMRVLCDLLRRSNQDVDGFKPLVSYYNGGDNTADFPSLITPAPVAVEMHPSQAREVMAATETIDAVKASTIPRCAAVLLPLHFGGGAGEGKGRGGAGEGKDKGGAAKSRNAAAAALKTEAAAAAAAALEAATVEGSGSPARGGAGSELVKAELVDAAAAPSPELLADTERYDTDVAALHEMYGRGLRNLSTLLAPAEVAAAPAAAAAGTDAVGPCAVPLHLMTPSERAKALAVRAPKLAKIAHDMVGVRGTAVKVFAYTQFHEAAVALQLLLESQGWTAVSHDQVHKVVSFLMSDVSKQDAVPAVTRVENVLQDETATYAQLRHAVEGLLEAAKAVLAALAGPTSVHDRPVSVTSLVAQMSRITSHWYDTRTECESAADQNVIETCIARAGGIAAELLAVYASASNMRAVLGTGGDAPLRDQINALLDDPEGAHNGKRFIMLPTMEQANALKVFNHFLNRDGDIIMGIVAAGSTLEGTNLKTVRRVIAVEPQLNAAKVRQLMGRARRYCSHAELPLGSRSVEFVRYASEYSESDAVEADALQTAYRQQAAVLEARRVTVFDELEESYRTQMRAKQDAVEVAKTARAHSETALRTAYHAVEAALARFREAKSAGGARDERTSMLLGALAGRRAQYTLKLVAARHAVTALLAARNALAVVQNTVRGPQLRAKLQEIYEGEVALDARARAFFERFGFAVTSSAAVEQIEGAVYASSAANEEALTAAYARLENFAADYTVLRNIHARMAQGARG